MLETLRRTESIKRGDLTPCDAVSAPNQDRRELVVFNGYMAELIKAEAGRKKRIIASNKRIATRATIDLGTSD